jgi:hypothetical protein
VPRYAQINDDVFIDLIKGEGLSWEAVHVYIYYTITSKNLIGMFRIDTEADMVSMGHPPLDMTKCLGELQEKGKVVFSGCWLWIVGKGKKVTGIKQEASARKTLKENIDQGVPSAIVEKFNTKYPLLAIPYRYPIDGVSAVGAPIPIPIPKPIKEDVSPSATSKKSYKEIQNEWIDKTTLLWKEVFGRDIEPSQLQMLVYGSRKRKISGFGHYETLITWIRDQKSVTYDGDPFPYALKVCETPAGIKGVEQKTWRKKDPQLLGDILNKMGK